MSSSDKNIGAAQTAGLQVAIGQIIAKAREEAHSYRIPDDLIGVFFERVLNIAAQETQYFSVEEGVRKYVQDAEKCHFLLQDVFQQIKELKSSLTLQNLYGENWWQQIHENLSQAFEKNPREGWEQWLRIYVAAFLNWELETCSKLVKEPFPFNPEDAERLKLFRHGTEAMVSGRYEHALEMLSQLTRWKISAQSQPLLSKTDKLLVLIFIGRIYLYRTSDVEMATSSFEHAQRTAPDDARPYAALGDAARFKGNKDEALKLYQQAIELSSVEHSGEIGMGLWSEDQELWDEADDWYEKAIKKLRLRTGVKNIQVELSKMLAPVSGNLYLHLARKLKKEDAEAALAAVNQALDLGIKHVGDYPERIAYRLKGEVLELLDRSLEAAEAYFKAGQKFYYRAEYQIAAVLLRQANKLDPSHLLTYWTLFDVLRISSYLPTPPYFEPGLVNEGLDVWERGVQLELPTRDSYWAYNTRALINEQLARMSENKQSDKRPPDLWWEAIVYLERGLLLSGEESDGFAFLSRYHHNLNNSACALQTSQKAIDINPTSRIALEDRAIVLTNLGEDAEALAILERRMEIEPDAWTKSVKAVILGRNGDYQAAIDLLNEALTADPESSWSLINRALLYRMMDEDEKADEDYRKVLGKGVSGDHENQSIVAWAAYSLGQYEEARIIYERLCKDAEMEGNARRNLGSIYLAMGDIERGRRELSKGIELSQRITELNEVGKMDFRNLEKSISAQPHWEQVQKVIEELTAQIETRKAAVLERQRRPATDELEELLETFEKNGKTDGWGRLGAIAELARLSVEQKRWQQAAGLYLDLQKSENFPEASIGIAEVVEGYQSEADEMLLAGRPGEALEPLTLALELAQSSLSTNKEREADLYARLGVAYLELQDTKSARDNWKRAIKHYTEAEYLDPGHALGETCRNVLPDIASYWKLNSALKEFAAEDETEATLRQHLVTALGAAAAYLDYFYKLSQPTEQFPEVPPVLELGSYLVPEDTGPDWMLFKKYLPEMRERIKNEMGVGLPRILVRANETYLLPGGYNILLDDVSVDSGVVEIDKHYLLAATGLPHSLENVGEEMIPMPDPISGRAGYWVPSQHLPLLEEQDLQRTFEPLVYAIFHLEAVLRRNLAEFLTFQEMDRMIETWKESEDGSALVSDALPDLTSRLRFAKVLRALLAEEIPVTSWREILEVVRDVGLDNDDVREVVGAIRLRIKRMLPGNDATRKRIELPIELEHKISGWLRHDRNKTFIAAPVDELGDVLAAFRELGLQNQERCVLVTRSAEVRPFLVELMTMEFPNLIVLSREELLTPDEQQHIDRHSQIEGA
jgi:tetratricopeptide (TPR) repeat protein